MLGQLEVVVAERNPELDWIVAWVILYAGKCRTVLKIQFLLTKHYSSRIYRMQKKYSEVGNSISEYRPKKY